MAYYMISLTMFNINNYMGFHNILQESLRNTGLKRIRIKTDPSKVQNHEDFADIDGYEGYILAESSGNLKILVLTHDMPIRDLPPEIIQHIHDEASIDTIEGFKRFVKEYLLSTKGKKQNDPVFAQIDNSSTLSDVEQFLLQAGVKEFELNNLYRVFIEHE